MPLTHSAAEFAAKWRENARRESASSQEHFIDLCRLLDLPTPNEADPSQDWYCFERYVDKSLGGKGWADVWKRGHFGWEYKGDHADLNAAYRQLLDYREDLENPPALVVSDMDRIQVRTNFTGTRPQVYEITLDHLAGGGDQTAEALRILRAVMIEPDPLKPTKSSDEVTQVAASRFADLARSMQERGHEPETVAHFLNRVLFCLFAEDVGLLPRGLMTDLIASRKDDPEAFTSGLADLFRLMSDRDSGRFFGTQRIEWFNGGLFDDDSVLPFTRDELRTVADASSLDWSQVEPAILGTLFERGLDPDKRGQLGAHYTDREKILMVVEPVVMTPLRREFGAMQERVAGLMKDRQPSPLTRDGKRRANLPKWERDAEAEWRDYLKRLRDVRVLDPACGSGNFLYVTLRLLKDLEQEAIRWGAERLRITGEFPRVAPHNVLGIEINPYAKELAGVAIWIGHIQWMLDHGYGFPRDPVLQPLDNIELRDAILAYDEDGNPIPATWPGAEFIVGNPPFIGDKLMRLSLGPTYHSALREAWMDVVPGGADLVCYWHETTRQQIESGVSARAGLLATNSIRGGANRQILDNVKESGDIFLAWSDEPWIVEGASVRVSIVGQDDGSEHERELNGRSVGSINADLTSDVDLTLSKVLGENQGSAFLGVLKTGPFDVSGDLAREMLEAPTNVNGRTNSDVVVPRVNGMDITRRPRGSFVIDFGSDTPESVAAEYEVPFEYVTKHVRPVRAKNRLASYRDKWWLHARTRPSMRSAVAPLARFVVTPTVSKHRLFVWLDPPTLPDHQLVVIARDDDYAFGVLHSRAHELWSLRMGTSLEDRPRYTPTTTFETFPFPWPLNTPDDVLTPEQREHRDAIGAAAKELDDKRRLWLNPPEWVRKEPDVIPTLPNILLPVDDEAAEQLKKRTLTNLYNQRPTWLDNLHRTLAAAVFAAYGWPANVKDGDILEGLLALNLERAARH
ncbi:MAG: class I SAM-dependent DNA methyltransferase [Chloroflexi bacterium]|nr:class I SAM-dependent DNA methyltransferase [Chloroflexota bacterium]MCY3587150.1 class I SAM-dependent DNA methyltransferase [Chloroflexota bacterium]MCY3685739.1 class I SAM-dependent DNA methyltransferase [Chloroflexota bacterium]MDE2708040.1 class I SAM-dependent DNA methyltransferase [Chloroflexota bacterium]